jgi:predicted transposase YdaD
MYSKVFAEKARYLKETVEGRAKMGSEIERIREVALEDGKIEIAMNLICRRRYSLEEIAEDTGLSVEKVRELANSKAS